jgi:hypothetical protein
VGRADDRSQIYPPVFEKISCRVADWKWHHWTRSGRRRGAWASGTVPVEDINLQGLPNIDSADDKPLRLEGRQCKRGLEAPSEPYQLAVQLRLLARLEEFAAILVVIAPLLEVHHAEWKASYYWGYRDAKLGRSGTV